MRVAGQGWRRATYTHLISRPILVGIQCSCCESLFSMLEDYLGPAWQFLGTVKCHCAKITCFKLLQRASIFRNLEIAPISTTTCPNLPRPVPTDNLHAQISLLLNSTYNW